jgi:hypothetical protein
VNANLMKAGAMMVRMTRVAAVALTGKIARRSLKFVARLVFATY